MIEKIKQPYEFLVRIKGGLISGAHVKRLEVVKDSVSGEIYSEKELPAEQIDLTDEEKRLIMKRVESN